MIEQSITCIPYNSTDAVPHQGQELPASRAIDILISDKCSEMSALARWATPSQALVLFEYISDRQTDCTKKTSLYDVFYCLNLFFSVIHMMRY